MKPGLLRFARNDWCQDFSTGPLFPLPPPSPANLKFLFAIPEYSVMI